MVQNLKTLILVPAAVLLLAVSPVQSQPASAAGSPQVPAVAGPLDATALKTVLSRHSGAMGGDKARLLLKRVKTTARVKMYGLVGTVTEYADGAARRSEAIFPSLPFEEITVWDGNHLSQRGTNGDVRELGDSEVEDERAEVAISSLDYLRDGTRDDVKLLASTVDKGQRYERIQVAAPGATPVEIWLDQTGATRRTIRTSDGVVVTTYIDEYGAYDGVPLPRRTRQTKSSDNNVIESETLEVKFPASLPSTLFAPPQMRPDATFRGDAASVTVPLALWEGRYVMVQARLAGHIGTFILDSGASSTVYDYAFLKKIGAKPEGQIAPAAGLFKGISFVHVPPLEVADLQIAAQTVLAIDLHAPDSQFSTEVDGILGYDLLSRFPITIDYVGGWLTFWKPGSYRPVAGEVAVPVTFVGTSMRVPVRINGEDAGQFEIDTGNGRYCAVQHASLKTPLAPPKGRGVLFTHGLEFGTGAASAYLMHADVTVGQGKHAITWKSAPVTTLNLQDPKASSITGAGNIGNAWLRHFRFTMDYGARTVYFLPRKPFRPSSFYGQYGLSLKPNRGKLYVYDLAEESRARGAAGLQVGDEVLDVDGVPALQTNNQWPVLLGDPVPGETHVVRVRRGTSILSARLTAVPIE
jgi:hypothetical protein